MRSDNKGVIMDPILSIILWGIVSIAGLAFFCAVAMAIVVRTFQFVFRLFGL
jgi:hypothetical protein